MAAPDLPGEFEIIARYFVPLAATEPLAFGLTDDAALIRPTAGCDLVVTTDGMVSGVHFFPDDPPARVAAKLLRVNLSDLAAMGARPRGYVLVSAWPGDITTAWIEDFVAGLAADQARYGIALLGGDTVRTPGPLSLTVTAFGEVESGRALRRNGARPGDAVFVSGSIGDAGLGLSIRRGGLVGLAAGDRDFLLQRHQLPEPRLELGRELIGIASAAIDVSDGLVADLGHICDTSGVAAVIDLAQVPLSAAARQIVRQQPDLLPGLLGAGDDYELCFTVAPEHAAQLPPIGERTKVGLTRIGRIEAGSGVTVIGPDGLPVQLTETGFHHF